MRGAGLNRIDTDPKELIINTETLEAPAAASAKPIRHANDLPGPPGLPWFGNALQIDPAKLHLQLEAWARQYGPFFKIKIGPRRITVIGDHEAVATVLRSRPDGFSRTSRLQEIWVELGLQPGVFGANGDVWKRQRRMVMAGFDPAHVKRYFPSLQAVAQRLAGRWTKAAREGRAIDLQADLMRYTVDTIAGLAFGASVNTLESDDDVIQRHLDKLFPAIFKRLFSTVATWRIVRMPADRRVERSIQEVIKSVDGFVQQARLRMAADPTLRENPSNLLEAMIAAADQPDSGIDDGQVAGNVLTMLLAGEDTTANTLAWMIHLLWRHPAMLARAVAEVREITDACADVSADANASANANDALTMEQLADLPFVEACIHETMRLKPVAPVLPLQAIKDITVGDVLIPAGRVVINLMRRDSVSESHLPNAAAFDPTRWLADGGPAAQASAAKRISMPFGAGPRICPGRYLAMLEMKIAMATLLGRFDILAVDTPDGGEAREHLSFTMLPVGLKMRLRERA